MGLSRIVKVAMIGAFLIPITYALIQNRDNDAEKFNYLTPCSANASPSLVNGNEFATYTGVHIGVPILFPAQSGRLIGISISPGEKHGRTLETVVYDTTSGQLRLYGGSGFFNFADDPQRGDIIGAFTQYPSGIYGDSQLVMSFQPSDSNRYVLPTFSGCVN